jgi:hypothetical protein
MGVDFATIDYWPNFNLWSRPIVVTPVVSQPGVVGYMARGIYDTAEIDVQAEDGSVITDHRTIVDILESEFGVLPVQGDIVSIGYDPSANDPALGNFEIINVWHDGAGETSLQLRKIMTVP